MVVVVILARPRRPTTKLKPQTQVDTTKAGIKVKRQQRSNLFISFLPSVPLPSAHSTPGRACVCVCSGGQGCLCRGSLASLVIQGQLWEQERDHLALSPPASPDGCEEALIYKPAYDSITVATSPSPQLNSAGPPKPPTPHLHHRRRSCQPRSQMHT